MDYSVKLTSRSGPARLVEVLMILMRFDEFKIEEDDAGGFIASKSFRKAKEGSSFFGLSRMRVVRSGQEVIVDADLGVLRVMRYVLVPLMVLVGAIAFVDTVRDPKVADTPIPYILSSTFLAMAILLFFSFRSARKKALKMLERLCKAALEISETS